MVVVKEELAQEGEIESIILLESSSTWQSYHGTRNYYELLV